MSRLRYFAIGMISTFVVACDDDAGGRSSPDAGGGLLQCQEADSVFTLRLASEGPALVGCRVDDDCTTWLPRLECEERSVVLSPCTSPIAKAKVDAGAAWLAATGAELCPSIQTGCRATGDCQGGTLRCTAGSCAFDRSTPDAGQDAGATSCDVTIRAAGQAVRAAIDSASKSCASNDDCTSVFDSIDCSNPGCGAAIALSAESTFEAKRAALNATFCAGFADAGCRTEVPPPCFPQGSGCVDGQCRQVPLP